MNEELSAAEKIALVVTTISSPKKALQLLSEGCQTHKWDFIIIGDVGSPHDFQLTGSDYYDINRQLETGFNTAKYCPQKHYARKNIGYLLAIQRGADVIVETDDDNLPLNDFWEKRSDEQTAIVIQNTGWINVYSYFSAQHIWPRGLPLNYINNKITNIDSMKPQKTICPIQQGLANNNPDVDAIYRLVLPLPQFFVDSKAVALGKRAWSPFNSQNTTWSRDAFSLMYLPSYCSFRMTDIWRSLIAQRIAWENRWSILFHYPTVLQEHNDHNLLKDFKDEIPGYLNNESIQIILDGISLKSGVKNISESIRICYDRLIKKAIFDERELFLLEAWLDDLKML